MPSTIAFDFSVWQLLALSLAGAAATGLNTLAGGGSLLSFPVLVALGIPPLTANATNAFALTLGGISGAISSTGSISRIWPYLTRFAAPTLAGAALGAWLLLVTTQRLFELIVPILLLAATMILALRNVLINKTALAGQNRLAIFAPICLLGVAVYGGYFGAGQGIVFLAVLELFSPAGAQNNNAIKNWLQCLVNIVAASIFFTNGTVLLAPGLALMTGGLFGGYAAGVVSKRMHPDSLRLGVIVYGFMISVFFATKAIL